MLKCEKFDKRLRMKIAYLTNCFGTQSHTFIRREIAALRSLNVEIVLFGVKQDFVTTAPDAKPLVEETHYLYPIKPTKLLTGVLGQLLNNPARFLCGAYRAFAEEEFSFKRRLKMLYHYFVATSLVKELKFNEITHIHAHFMNASASIAMYAAFHARLPFSITVHSAGTYRTPHILGVKQKLKSAKMLMMISNYNIDYFDKIYPCRDKSHLVRCGMDFSQYAFHPAALPRSDSTARLLCVGRFVEKKGFKYLVEACALLKKKRFAFKLTLVGDGPLLTELKKAVTDLELNDAVTFTGKLASDEVEREMKNADLVVVPSVTSASGEMEGLPVVIMEAMALGIPVIATQHSGIPEIVVPNLTGQLVPEKDPTSLAAMIEKSFHRANNDQIVAAKRLLDEEFNIGAIAMRRKLLFANAHKE